MFRALLFVALLSATAHAECDRQHQGAGCEYHSGTSGWVDGNWGDTELCVKLDQSDCGSVPKDFGHCTWADGGCTVDCTSSQLNQQCGPTSKSRLPATNRCRRRDSCRVHDGSDGYCQDGGVCVPSDGGHGFKCSLHGCKWADFVEGIDYDYYVREGQGTDDCDACTARCAADPNCGAVECDGGYCSWWKKGRCTFESSPQHLDVIKTCRPAGERPPLGPACADKNVQCAAWAANNECDANPGYMQAECKLSCGVCGGQSMTTVDDSCDDSNAGCAGWAANGECNNNPAWMHANCRLSCGICQASSWVVTDDS